jgi:hypothetical protein
VEAWEECEQLRKVRFLLFCSVLLPIFLSSGPRKLSVKFQLDRVPKSLK